MKEFDQTYITRPFLPDLEEFLPYLEKIWETRCLTNNGPFHQQLEQKLCEYLEVPYISLFANGTLALLTALQALNISGEVITTPYSFVATTHALWWNNITPVFADIEPESFTINPEKIEAAITNKTSAILPVHVYGYPCKIDAIKEIGSKYNLKVIYDAAHTMGAKFRNLSLSSFGDISILSFHATKIFNTFEGGAIVCNSAEMKQRIDHLKNFGFDGETTVVGPGINAKMNEFQAALGLLQINYLDNNIIKRKEIYDIYLENLKDAKGVILPRLPYNFNNNYAYFPLLIKADFSGLLRDRIYHQLKSVGIHTRRYFFPLITHFSPYKSMASAQKSNLPIANNVADNIICLPIYPDLHPQIITKITEVIKNHLTEF